ncbi:sigma-70 family RNA polymerase sigma factor [Streptomyces sp. WAC00276]|uniref:sigma-70 family RNA polymerase sigma factor n=1 Tax=Streptomyces sp. WAC00276 TaxID=2933778 RepID=UPI001FFFC150|nr:sigma-70 family RNA polymerase sigma factor [Streptomyces sp. WAC00276]MCK2140205.1 sigma-70 family RNA polymerase sigma factor [Streptomyces sp. WAC00276]
MTTAATTPLPPAPSTAQEAEIADGIRAGDARCLALAYQRWGGMVQGLATRSLGDPLEAEDVTQQVFLAAWRGGAHYRPERGPLAAWLVGIARHKIADALASRTRRSVLTAAAASLPQGPDPAAQPEICLDRVLVRAELARLPDPHRRVLWMAYFGELTQAEIAARTGLPLGTVKSHARRGLHRLRASLERAESE